MTHRLEVVQESHWASVVARDWEDRLGENPRMVMCLPAGATPRPVYETIAERADFSASTVLLLDEFGLPEGDPARCDAMFRTDLLDRLGAEPAVFDRLDPGATDLEAECDRYAAVAGEGRIDLAIVGLGTNGHIGLNEPGSTPGSTTRRVQLAPETRAGLRNYGQSSDTDWGLTLGMSELLAAGEIWLWVTGAHKAEILDRYLSEPIGPEVPATYLRTRGDVTVWADTAALEG